MNDMRDTYEIRKGKTIYNMEAWSADLHMTEARLLGPHRHIATKIETIKP